MIEYTDGKWERVTFISGIEDIRCSESEYRRIADTGGKWERVPSRDRET